MSEEMQKKEEENRIEEEKAEEKKAGKPKHPNRAYFMRKYCFAVVFTVLLLTFSGYNIIRQRAVFQDEIQTVWTSVRSGDMSVQKGIAALDDTASSELSDRMKYIEVFAYVQKLLDKKEISNFKYIKDETGSLHYASFYRADDKDCFEYAMRVKRLQDYVSQYGTDVLFVVAPSKFVPNDNRLQEDMPVNDPQVLVDETLFYLNRLGIETLDLNRYIPNAEVPYEEAFFKTDHHWSIPAAFYATGVLADTLNDRFGYGLDKTYLDGDNFTREVYRQGMLGSMGRGSGVNYSGLDDMTAFYPEFHMEISRHTLEENGRYSDWNGDIIGTLILPQYLDSEDIYKDSQYSIYLNGLRTYESIQNKSNPDGKKIFMIRDSYFSPVISFLTPLVGQIDAVWSLEESEEIDIEEYIMSNRFDCIIIEMYPYNIEDKAFRYFKGEE